MGINLMAPFGPTVTINGQQVQAKVVPLTKSVTLDNAKKLLDDKKDGYDTYGAKLGGKDVLILTQQEAGIATSDDVRVGKQRASIDFVENEKQSSLGRTLGTILATGVGAVGAFKIAQHVAPKFGAAGAGVLLIAGAAAAIGGGVLGGTISHLLGPDNTVSKGLSK